MRDLPAAMPRTALVTGAGARIGRDIALRLARAGFAVAVHCRDSLAAAESTADECRRLGVQACVLQADLSQDAQAGGLVARAAASLGPLGVLINNASLFERDEWDDADRESWDRHLDVNARAPLLLMQAFARALPDDAQGCVVNLLDQRVWSLTPHFVSYTVSKSALWSLTRSMALALAPRIRVNAVGPGPAAPSARQTQAQFDRQCAALPLGRGTDPAEIADAVFALLTLGSVTGQMIAVDGGQHLQWHAAPPGGGMVEE